MASHRSVWARHGCILAPDQVSDKYRLLQAPVGWVLENGLVRIAVSARNADNIASMLILDCDPADDMKIVTPAQQAALTPDQITARGWAGFGPTDAIWHNGQLLMFGSSIITIGQIYDASIWVMTSADAGKTFSDPQTILTSDDNGGFPVTMPCARYCAEGWQMWFTAFEAWLSEVTPHPDARYAIRAARSDDGLNWTMTPGKTIPLDRPHEAGLARPTLAPTGRPLEMWFSVRGPYCNDNPTLRRYRLGYARSTNGVHWQRHDNDQVFSNPPSTDDWDGDMQCYPNVFHLPDGRQCMLYCGNGYGATGFGWATRCRERNAP